MPTSWQDVIPSVMERVKKLEPKSILDIGIGFGKYGVLMRDLLELPYKRYDKESWLIKMDGVEAFQGYKNPLHDFVYNQVFYENITDLVDKLPQYDVILLIDVLEHFEKSEGLALLKSLVKITKKALIVSTPLFPEQQEEYLGNTFEEHKSRWMNIDLSDFDFTAEQIRIRENAAQFFVIYPPEEKTIDYPMDEIPEKLPPAKEKPLTIGYFLPHHNLTGGMKMLLEQMKHLQKRGHKIVAFYHGEEGSSAIPSWYDLRVEKEVVIPEEESFLSFIDGCDIGVAGWLEQMPELAGATIPIVYWEQGNEWIFGESLPHEYRPYLQYCYSQPVALASVSPLIAKTLEVRFNRKSKVIPNGIDVDFYYPEDHPNDNVVLLVGNPNLLFKGFDVAIRALIRAWRLGGRFKVKWACQDSPDLDDIPFPFPIEFIVNPPQPELAKLYRTSDLFLFSSWYEGFGMPPLEAMASGVPVVSTRCGGIDAYAEHGVNAILAEPGDAKGLAEGITFLLNHPEEREKLSQEGRNTALKLKFSNIVGDLEKYFLYLVDH